MCQMVKMYNLQPTGGRNHDGLSMMKKELRSEIEIDALRSEVWKILLNFQEHEEWNPFIYPIEGKLSKECRIFVLIHLQD